MKNIRFINYLPLVCLTGFAAFSLVKGKNVSIALIIAFIVAYLLKPIKNQIKKIVRKDSIASFVSIIAFFSFLISISAIVLPRLYKETFQTMKFFYGSSDAQKILEKFLPIPITDLKIENFNQDNLINSGQIIRFTKNSFLIFLKIFYKSGKAALKITISAIFAILMSFFILKDWEKITFFIEKIIPIRFQKKYNEIIFEVNAILEKYLKGQIAICFLVGLYYSISLYFIGIKTFFIIGIISGVLCFIPYIGFSTSLVLSILITRNQDPELLINTAIVYIVGAIFENYICTPKLMGKQIDIPPSWIIFSVFLIGTLFGFTGVLVAIPITAVARVFSKHLLKKYFESNIYKKIEKN